MANPFAESRTFHRIGHITNTLPLKTFPTPAGIAIVTTVGRKTGKRRARAMRGVRDGQRVYAVALLGAATDWLANARANPDVSIRLGTRQYRARARTIQDETERRHARDAYHPIAGWYDYFDYLNFAWSIPTRGRLLSAHDRWFDSGTPVVFELLEDSR